MATKPKLALIPSAYKAGQVYSVLPSSGVGDFDFSRSNQTATRVNKDGLIETVGSNIPRLNYPMIDGVVSGCPSLLLEPERRNLFPYSEDYSQSVYTRRNCTINQKYAISPSGLLDATLVSASGSDAAIFDNIGVTSGNTYTLSVYLRVESGTLDTTISLGSAGFPDTSGDGGRVKDITITTEWKRFTLTSIADADAGSDIGIIGGFGGFNNGDSILVWGAQLEEGSYPTSYIPTNGGSVTRSAETCNGSGDANTFNDSEGVLMAEINFKQIQNTSRYISVNDGGSTDRILFGVTGNTNNLKGFVYQDGQPPYLLNTDININSTQKIALSYKTNLIKFYVSGFKIGEITTAVMPTGLNRLSFNDGVAADFYGNTKQLQYFDTALTDTDLEQLTSWTSFNEMATSQLYTIQ